MDRAFIQKLIWTVLALGVWGLAAVPYFAEAAAAFHTAAGVIFGGAWITKPGDAKAVVTLLALCSLPLMGACAGSPADNALQNRLAANELRDTVNEASDTLAQAHGALPFICAYFGEQSAACASLEDGYRITASAIDTVHRGIDLLDAVGIGAEQTRSAAERVLSEAKAFGSAVQRTGEEVANAIEGDRRADSDSGEGLGRGVEPGPDAERAPAAQDGGAAPAAAPAP